MNTASHACGSTRQAALERQDLSCSYLAHHELDSVMIFIIIYACMQTSTLHKTHMLYRLKVISHMAILACMHKCTLNWTYTCSIHTHLRCECRTCMLDVSINELPHHHLAASEEILHTAHSLTSPMISTHNLQFCAMQSTDTP